MTDHDILVLLDGCHQEVSNFEAEILETLLKRWPHWPAHWPTPRQRAVLRHMADKYLDPHAVAEWLGQQRLFAQ